MRYLQWVPQLLNSKVINSDLVCQPIKKNNNFKPTSVKQHIIVLCLVDIILAGYVTVTTRAGVSKAVCLNACLKIVCPLANVVTVPYFLHFTGDRSPQGLLLWFL